LQQSIASACEQQQSQGLPSVLLVSAALRWPLAQFVERLEVVLPVLAFAEIPPNKPVRVAQILGQHL